jgi:Skp family chaperone for outer membrane proteins
MNRLMIASAVGALLLSGTAAAQAPQTPAAPATAPAAPAPAQTSAAPAPFPADAKIGYVDPQLVLSNSASGKAGMAQLEQLVQKKQAEIAAKNTEIQKLSQEIQANQSVWSAAVNSQKQAELTKQQNELQFMRTQAETETDALEQQMLREFQDKVIPLIETIRAEKGLWVILTNGAGSVVALDPRLDLSAEVVRRLDAAK